MRFMGSVQSSQNVCVKSHKKSVLFQRDTSRISKDIHEFLGFIGCYQLLTLVFTLQIRVTIHFKISKKFTSHNEGFLVFGYVYAGQNNATLLFPSLNVHILILVT